MIHSLRYVTISCTRSRFLRKLMGFSLIFMQSVRNAKEFVRPSFIEIHEVVSETKHMWLGGQADIASALRINFENVGKRARENKHLTPDPLNSTNTSS
jgi:hypothetical protein